MTTQTPVATIWEPQLAKRSLPGGVPLTAGDETPISGDAARVLVTGQGPAIARIGEAWIAQPRERLAERVWVTFDRASASGPGAADRLFRYQVVQGGIIAADSEVPLSRDANYLHALITRVKDRLSVDWDTVIDLLAIPRRTFFTYRRRGELPDDRVSDLGSRIVLLASVVDEDVDAARVMVATKKAELIQLLEGGRFAEARRLFATVRNELAAAVSNTPLERPLDVVSKYLDTIAHVSVQPGFENAARALLSFSQQSGSYNVERLQALIATERSIRQARAGAELAEDWDFLPIMKRIDLDEFRARAASFIGSPAFSPEAWPAYLASEAERAWAAYHPVILPPDVVEPLPGSEIIDDRFAGAGMRSYSQRVGR